jgi:hypothetical protein
LNNIEFHVIFLFASFDQDSKQKKMPTLGFIDDIIVKKIKQKLTQPLPTKGDVA